ncbi:MAG: glycosyltransferase, partial [Candidatus Omnitrophica bacterium]|nr:glycosyltransferase [Candidatus Omnitrophota bacterium]
MRILQILPELNVGGVETGTVDFANYLVENGHKSVVISNGGALVEKLAAQGSTHYTLPVHKKSLIAVYRMIAQVRAVILKEKIQIVHARSRVPA